MSVPVEIDRLVTPFWTSAFLDFAARAWDDGVTFWSAVTGYAASPVRGDDGEFATLVPPAGDDYLRVQRLGSGESRIHLDLHVEDPRLAADRALGLGATEVADLGYVVLTSPGGFTFCFVSHPAARSPASARWPGGSSQVDQVCLDIPPSLHEVEVRFWTAVTGRELRPSPGHPEFQRLVRPDHEPLHLLLQRLDEADGPVTAHLDLAVTDRDAETERHRTLGAEVEQVHEHWTVLCDPAGSAYCLTDRAPRTG